MSGSCGTGTAMAMNTISKITETTRNQLEFVAMISGDMTKIADVVTTVSATAEESEAASEELLTQENQLNTLVDLFKV